MRFSKKFIKEFEANTKYPESLADDIKTMRLGGNPHDQTNNLVKFGNDKEGFFTAIKDALEEKEIISIRNEGNVELNFSSTEMKNNSLIEFEGWQINNLSSPHAVSNIKDKNIYYADLRDAIINNCVFGTLIIYPSDGLVKIKNSIIGTLTLNKPFKKLIIKNSRIQKLVNGEGGIINDVIFENVVFETSSKSEIYTGEQGFRDFRIKMEAKENSEAANIMRVHELRSERERDTGLTWLVSKFYDIVSEYGTNATRSFIWFIISIIFTGIVINYFDGATLAQGVYFYNGWQENLISDSTLRSYYLAAQSVFNPAGIFGFKHLVVANTGSIQAFVSFMTIVSFSLLLTTIFSLRKRFKVHM